MVVVAVSLKLIGEFNQFCKLGVNMEQVIVDSSYGNFVVYRATVENAKKILDCHIDGMDSQALEIFENDKKVLKKESISQIINKILSKEEGSMASKTIQVTKEIKQEVVMYCFNNKIAIKNNQIDEYELFKVFKISDFSFFANHESYDKEAELVDEYVIEQARKYRVITEDKWKEGASEIAKINYILQFAQELAHRDVKYELSELRDQF